MAKSSKNPFPGEISDEDWEDLDPALYKNNPDEDDGDVDSEAD